MSNFFLEPFAVELPSNSQRYSMETRYRARFGALGGAGLVHGWSCLPHDFALAGRITLHSPRLSRPGVCRAVIAADFVSHLRLLGPWPGWNARATLLASEIGSVDRCDLRSEAGEEFRVPDCRQRSAGTLFSPQRHCRASRGRRRFCCRASSMRAAGQLRSLEAVAGRFCGRLCLPDRQVAELPPENARC